MKALTLTSYLIKVVMSEGYSGNKVHQSQGFFVLADSTKPGTSAGGNGYLGNGYHGHLLSQLSASGVH